MKNNTSPLTRVVYTQTHKVEQILLSEHGHWAPLKRWNLKTGVREL